MVRVCVNAEEHAVKMLSELRRMQRDEIDCDFQIKVENDVYHTHRNVMSAGSEYIRDKLANKSHISMPMLYIRKHDSECMKSCIDFIYSGELEIPDGKIENVLKLGTKLRLDGVKQVIAGTLFASLNAENCFSTKKMADTYGLKEVSVKCRHFFKENLMEIANMAQFGTMSVAEVVHLLMTEEGKFTEHDKLVILLKWAEKNSPASYVLLEPIRRVMLDSVSPAFLKYLLKSHPVVTNDLATYKLISDHLLEFSEKLIEANESYRGGKESKSQVPGNSSDVGNTPNDNNTQSHAVVIKDELLDTFALPAIPSTQTLCNRPCDPEQNVVSGNIACVTVTMPCRPRRSCVQKYSTPKKARLHENCPNKALWEALMNLLVNKTPDDIAIDQEGFAYVEDIVKHRKFRRFSLSEKEVYDLMKNNESCFAIKGEVGHFQIRATCGHPFELKTDSLDNER